MWVKISNSRWDNFFGNSIIKYKMAGSYYFLCYKSELDFEYGDYVTKGDLNSAKLYLDKRNAETYREMQSLLIDISLSESKGLNFKSDIDSVMYLDRDEESAAKQVEKQTLIRNNLIKFLNELGSLRNTALAEMKL